MKLANEYKREADTMTSYLSQILLVIFAGLSLCCGTTQYSGETIVGTALPTPAERKVEPVKGEQTAVFAGGCFWGIEGVFEHVNGVLDARSGYSGGTKATANYDIVSEGKTGHAESVKVRFDPTKVTYHQLLEVFFSVAHDPTELNYQGPDHGTQYRSAIFYANEEQRQEAQAYIAELTKNAAYASPIVTQVVPLEAFYDAEKYHQNYMKLNPTDKYIVYNDAPKVAALKDKFPALYIER